MTSSDDGWGVPLHEIPTKTLENGTEFKECADGTIWVRQEKGRWRRSDRMRLPLAPRVFPAVHYVNEQSDGRTCKFDTGPRNDRKEQPCLHVYADEVAKQEWHDYVVMPDGREGPAPFSSSSERAEYESRFGYRGLDKDEVHDHPLDQFLRQEGSSLRRGDFTNHGTGVED